MKKKLLYGLLLIAIAAFVSLSGCISFLNSDSPSENEASAIAEIYNLSVFYPTILGQEKIVESGTYYVASNVSDIKIVRLIDNKKEIKILEENGLFAFTDAEIKDVYFVTDSDFTMTKENIETLINNPISADLNYTIKKSSRSSQIVLEKNFSGILVYTFVPSSNSKAIVVNDGSKAVKIVLPPEMTTGNRFIGTARPAPDLTESGENGEKILKWNNPVGQTSVKYYSEKAPFYMTVTAFALIGLIAAVYLWNRYQIQKLQKISKYIDPDENDGFSRQKKN
jgi:hypothetical protein